MDSKDVQRFLQAQPLYGGEVDGSMGQLTRAAIATFLNRCGIKENEFLHWPPARRELAMKQLMCKLDDIDPGKIDGLNGPQTKYALSVWDARRKGTDPASVDNWRDDEKAPPARDVPELPPVTSSKVETRRAISSVGRTVCGASP